MIQTSRSLDHLYAEFHQIKMDFSPAACISIIAPDGSPIYIRKYQPPTTQSTSNNMPLTPQISNNSDDLQVESVIFDSLQQIRKFKLLSVNRSQQQSIPQIITVPSSSDDYYVFACPTSLKYLIIILTFKQFAPVDITIKRCAVSVSEQLFQRINDPFYQPFSNLDNSAAFNKIMDESAAIIRSQPS